VERKQDMRIIRTYPTLNQCKITLNFTSSQAGNYRLTFAISILVKDYINKTASYQYELTYKNYTLVFDWSDIASIPNLKVSHGIKNDYFWFRMRRDNIPQGIHVELDPNVFIMQTEEPEPDPDPEPDPTNGGGPSTTPVEGGTLITTTTDTYNYTFKNLQLIYGTIIQTSFYNNATSTRNIIVEWDLVANNQTLIDNNIQSFTILQNQTEYLTLNFTLPEGRYNFTITITDRYEELIIYTHNFQLGNPYISYLTDYRTYFIIGGIIIALIIIRLIYLKRR